MDKRSGNGEAEAPQRERRADGYSSGERCKASLAKLEIRRAVEAARREKPAGEKLATKIEEQ